jgi:hypothetical protein
MNSKGILLVASLFGVAIAAGCSSSSSNPPSGDDGGGTSSGSSGGSSSSGTGVPEAMINLTCMGGDCDGGACCAMGSISTFSFSSACQASCTISVLTPQLCATTADCPSGYTCGANILGMGPMSCNQAGGSSSSSSGGSSEGGSSSSSGGSEGGTSSGAEGGADAAGE